jgi:hypothetical protein
MLRPEEKAIFSRFFALCGTCGLAGSSCREGADPPDYICTATVGKRIGVELAEWLNEDQMRESIQRERLERSYLDVVKSKQEPPPVNFGFVWLGTEHDLQLDKKNGLQFRSELYQCIRKIDRAWRQEENWQSPQGRQYSDFSGFPTLKKHLMRLTCFPRSSFNTKLGSEWVAFPMRVGAYSPQTAVDALSGIIARKTQKYGTLRQDQQLDELHLLVYYNKGLLHNLPYVAPEYGFNEVAAEVAPGVAAKPGPFQKVYLLDAVEGKLITLWP